MGLKKGKTLMAHMVHIFVKVAKKIIIKSMPWFLKYGFGELALHFPFKKITFFSVTALKIKI